jgi:hypothetical protein
MKGCSQGQGKYKFENSGIWKFENEMHAVAVRRISRQTAALGLSKIYARGMYKKAVAGG